MTDLERFFVQLVRKISADDRARLTKPLFLVDIRNSILPYRANRRALQLESSEDYELVLMRLCAGEGGFARIGPDEVGDEFRKELQSRNPDLTIVSRHQQAVVHLDSKAVSKALDPKPDLAYAPPPSSTKSRRASREPRTPTSEQADRQAKAARCTRCGGALPTGRSVNFCPQCGLSLTRLRCQDCATELEPGWRHCVNCGAAVPEM